jgi:enolase
MKIIILPNEKYGPPLVFMGNHLKRTANLSKISRLLLDLFILVMRRNDNSIMINDDSFKFYQSYFKYELNRKLTYESFQEAVQELKKAHLISNIEDDIYAVNQNLFRKIAKILNTNPLTTGDRLTDIIDSSSDNEVAEFI